jgi:hypothetical protein
LAHVQFSGLEIERVISFVNLLRENRETVELIKLKVAGTASILADELSGTELLELEFQDLPRVFRAGYRRSLLFDQVDRGELSSTLSFGGINAIQEGWRLRDVQFEIRVKDVATSEPNITELLSRLSEDPSKISQEEVFTTVQTCRRVVMGLTATSAEDVKRVCRDAAEIVSNRFSSGLLPPVEANSLMELAEDIERTGYAVLKDLLFQYNQMSRPTRRCLVYVLRRRLSKQSLAAENTSSEAARLRQLTLTLLENIRGLCARVNNHQRVPEDELRMAMEQLEAISFVTEIDSDNADGLVEVAESLCLAKDRWLHANDDLARSLLAAAILALARLHRRTPHLFSESDIPDRRRKMAGIRSAILSLMDVTALRYSSQDKISQIGTLRMAAIAAAVQLVSRSDPTATENVAKKISDRLKESGRSPAPEEASVCADALAYLFEFDRALLLSRKPIKVAFEVLASVWAQSTLREVRRACARALIIGLSQGLSMAPVRNALQGRLDRDEITLRAICQGRCKAALQADLPTLVVVAAAEKFVELKHLAATLAPEYAHHTRSEWLRYILDFYARAELQFVGREFESALLDYDRCIERLELARAQAVQEYDRLVHDMLIRSLRARRTFTQISLNGISYGGASDDLVAILKAYSDSYSDLQRVAPQEHFDVGRHPDANLAYSMAKFFEGFSIAVNPAELGNERGSWDSRISEHFARAWDTSTAAQSLGWARFLKQHIKPMKDDYSRSQTAQVQEPIAGLPEWHEVAIGVLKGTASWVAGFVLIRARWQRRSLLRELPSEWGEYSIRPVGILACGRRLPW